MAPARRNSSLPEAHQPRVARWRRRQDNAAGGRERQPRRGLGIAQLERIRLGFDAGSTSAVRVANPVPNLIYPNANQCSVCYQKRKDFLEQNVTNCGTGSNVARNMQQGITQAGTGIGHLSYVVEYSFFGASEQSVLVGPSTGGEGGGAGAGGGVDSSGAPVSLDLSLRLSGF